MDCNPEAIQPCSPLFQSSQCCPTDVLRLTKSPITGVRGGTPTCDHKTDTGPQCAVDNQSVILTQTSIELFSSTETRSLDTKVGLHTPHHPPQPQTLRALPKELGL